ncbi:hypothetical protein B6U90_07015 [Thermoplasmatales archaeon ex4484_6]|nr:MAG: hypothetical protein B6U90_07015 [Thermoplasmatales archaeon ex4484_6]RLF68810.1 MAG: hypothetical protein DRN57_02905 [Thermoplasmata archaeon]
MGSIEVIKILLVGFPKWEARAIKESLAGKMRDFLEVDLDEAPLKILAYEPRLILFGDSSRNLDKVLEARSELDDGAPIIFLAKDKSSARKALLRGCEDYLMRPFEPFEIQHIAGRYLPEEEPTGNEGIILGPAPDEGIWRTGRSSGTMEPGHIYLVREPKPEKGMSMFRKELSNGTRGLSISRQNPRMLRKFLSGLNVELIWLTANISDSERCIDAKDLARITKAIDIFLKNTEQGWIYIDGLEYMVSQTDFHSILRFLQFMNDKIMTSDDNILVSLDPRAFSSQEMSLMERECVVSDM